VGCGGAPARISDGWAVAAGQKGAFVDRALPREGTPMTSAATVRECLPDRMLLSVLGEACDHETENRAPPTPSGDLEPGIPKPTPEVRWYCADELVVRVVFERCDSSGTGSLDGVRPLEIAVATHP
jgi:hypothetical protein